MSWLNDKIIALYIQTHKPEMDESRLQQQWLPDTFVHNVSYQKHPACCYFELILKTAIIIRLVKKLAEAVSM